jgi:hypothetical protein
MLAAFKKSSLEETCDISGCHRTIGNAAFRRGDFHQRLQPIHAARAVAYDLNLLAALLRFLFDRDSDGVGAHRQGAGILGNVNGDAHDFLASLTISSNRSGVTRPKTSLSTMTEGDRAQFPRQ